MASGIRTGSTIRPTVEKDFEADEQARTGRSWFASAKRALLVPFGVGTIDQALLGNKRGLGRALTPEQEKKLFDVAASRKAWQVAYWAALLAANTTARGCELKGLRIGEVNLLEKTLTIRRTSTKTDAGARIVPLNENAAWARARLLERARKIGATDTEHYLMPAAMFKHTKSGDPMKQAAGFDLNRPMRSWRTAWRNLTTKAKLSRLRFHDLRHHCITKLAEAGTPDHTLMAISGHVIREMLEHYSHVRMEAKRNAVAALEYKPEAPKIATEKSESKEVPVA